MEKKLESSFGPLIDAPVATVTDFSKDKDIVEYKETQVIEKTGEGPHDFIVKNVVEEVSRINRQEYLNSFSDDVGIKNILKKVNLTGDVTLLNQRGVGLNKEFVDTTSFPTNTTDAFNYIEKGHDAFDKLPDQVKSKMSMSDFVETFGQADFDKFILEQAEAIKNKTKKEGE